MSNDMKIKAPSMLDKEGIEKAITSIKSRGKKLDEDIQHAALSCLNHLELHKDFTLFNRLFLAMPRGSRKAAMTEWALQFGKLKANTEANKKTVPFLFDREKTTDLVTASQKPWYDFAPDKKPDEVCDIRALLYAVLNKADKAPGTEEPEVAEMFRTFVDTLPEKVEA